jgi:hypothetical protein
VLSFSPVVRIGTPPPPHKQASVYPPPLLVPGGGHTRLRERGWGVPIRTRGQTLWYSRYTVLWVYIYEYISVLNPSIRWQCKINSYFAHILHRDCLVYFSYFATTRQILEAILCNKYIHIYIYIYVCILWVNRECILFVRLTYFTFNLSQGKDKSILKIFWRLVIKISQWWANTLTYWSPTRHRQYLRPLVEIS